MISAPELDDDPRFSSNLKRIQNLPALVEILNDYPIKDTSENWLARMDAARLPAGPVNDILKMHADPQTRAREMIVEVDHPNAGRVKTIGHPVKYSRTPARVELAAPLLGQHSREVLAEAGYDASEIDALIDADTVIAA